MKILRRRTTSGLGCIQFGTGSELWNLVHFTWWKCTSNPRWHAVVKYPQSTTQEGSKVALKFRSDDALEDHNFQVCAGRWSRPTSVVDKSPSFSWDSVAVCMSMNCLADQWKKVMTNSPSQHQNRIGQSVGRVTISNLGVKLKEFTFGLNNRLVKADISAF